MAILSVRELVKVYRGRKVVDRVSLDVESGQVIGLLGPNGAGKTTTFYMTVGLVKPDGGQVFLDDMDITEYPMHIRARTGVGYLPQEASIFRKLTVRQNILAILETLPLTRRQRHERTDSLMAELGIAHVAESKAAVLSGGERRRLEITRALATEPAFMLLDEPFAGIDPLAVIDIKKIIAHLKDRKIGILISDHNVRETLGACDMAFILSEGRVIESGSPEQIASSTIARRIYLGEEFRL
ncbi:ABC transporter ATP-binding protein [Desulfosarcina alkanivorans]|jgi:lipopolysaccharide export system ATP-binding protein|uniref:ABC transporter ATP-binding protein n=1 Tax=Desulfosarcina alkanivorans TaxID=571177 RepID=A0A5K7YPJ6_9BACT|nr:LPS export ABC transporter ATP-binding protein [Desulfosarcina alkanivorans]BBO66537.1 ABC transporter ATP-binding protein [Desulfosarcina alkanivorans]